MTSFINQHIFHYAAITNETQLSLLEKHMCLKKNMIVLDAPLDTLLIDTSPPQPPPPPPPKTSCIINPKKEDSLFWCLFIANYGHYVFTSIESKYKNLEIEEKEKIMNYLKQNASLMKKEHKLTNVSIQEMMAELMVNKKTSFKTIIALCIYYKKNIIITNEDNNTFLMYNGVGVGEGDGGAFVVDDHHIIKCKNNTFLVDVEKTTKEKWENIQKNMLQIERYEKPLKGVSAYKMGDLENMASLLKLTFDTPSTTTKRFPGVKKEELYKKINETCVWMIHSTHV